MTMKDIFTSGLVGLKSKHQCPLSELEKGKTIGVDVSVFLHSWSHLQPIAMANTAKPRCQSSELECRIKTLNDAMKKHAKQVIHVFEGADLPLKSATKHERKLASDEHKKKLQELMQKQQRGGPMTEEDHNNAKVHWHGLSVPDEAMCGQVIHHMKENGMLLFGAPCEAENQLVELQQASLIDFVMTRDADLIALGATRVMFDFKMQESAEKATFVDFSREKVVKDKDHPEVSAHENHIPELATFLGADYQKRIHGMGPSKILGVTKSKRKKADGNSKSGKKKETPTPLINQCVSCDTDAKRKSLLLDLAEAKGVSQGKGKERETLIEECKAASNKLEFTNQLQPKSIAKIEKKRIGWAYNFPKAAAMFRCCPVFKLRGNDVNLADKDNCEIELGPLNPLLEGTAWEELLGFNPESIVKIPDAAAAQEFAALKRLLRNREWCFN